MAFSNSPRIPRENLVLALDPADTTSYRRLSAVEVMVVGGGGGGGMDMGGGGGGGGVIYDPNYKVTPGTEITVTVGAGGFGAPAGGTNRTDGVGPQPGSHQFTISATNGGDSVFGNITAKGGGFGASSYYGYAPNSGIGGTGASGGGCSAYTHGGERYVDSNNIPGQGYPGGNSGNPASGADDHWSGGGGGAGGRGTSGPNHVAPSGTRGDGGPGIIIPRMSPYWYAGGGGGSGYSGNGGYGGKGGGGGGAGSNGVIGLGDTNGRNNGANGGSGNNQPGGNAGANTGGGGGGGSHYNSNNKGGEGGSGIVIVRYNGPQAATGGTYSFSNGVSYHTFTSSGAFTPYATPTSMFDVSGNGRNATVAGTAIVASSNPPVFTFNNPGAGSGQPDYIEFGSGNSTGFNPIYFPYVSITVAFRFNSLNDYWERIFDFGRGGNNISNVSYNAVILTRYSTTSDIYLYTHGSYIGYQSTSFDTGLNVDLGTWQVITLTWQAGSQKIYKNGSLFGSWTNGYSLIDHIGPNRTDERYLLARSNWNDAGAKISYGPFYIHNRILSDGEIVSLHSNIKSRFGI